MASTDTTVSANETLREALLTHHLRLAQYPEIQQRYLLECRVCGEVIELEHWQQVLGRCPVCGTAWHHASPTFLVLVPDSIPVPEEE